MRIKSIPWSRKKGWQIAFEVFIIGHEVEQALASSTFFVIICEAFCTLRSIFYILREVS